VDGDVVEDIIVDEIMVEDIELVLVEVDEE
jgi:hypothetical protein